MFPSIVRYDRTRDTDEDPSCETEIIDKGSYVITDQHQEADRSLKFKQIQLKKFKFNFNLAQKICLPYLSFKIHLILVFLSYLTQKPK